MATTETEIDPKTDPKTDAQLQLLLKERFGFESFRTGQLNVIRSVIAGKDAVAVMPTGRGKSLCFLIPALYRPGITIVVSPLISLMQDQVRLLQKLGIEAGCLYSQQDVSEKKRIFSRLKDVPNGCPTFVLYISPERVQKEGFAQWIADKPISLFAVDEAHCISQWGHDFREDYGKLNLLRELRPEVPILGLTATATPAVVNDLIAQIGFRDPDRHVYGFYRPNLYYQVETCIDADEKLSYLKQALKQNPEGRVIIYCGTRRQTEELTQSLKRQFKGIGFYHAGIATEERSQIQKDFENGELRILAATNAFGMGIDHPDVRLVVHYQMPANVESYYQEVGRAGRDGQESTCLLLYAKKDKGLQSYFITESTAPAKVIDQRWRGLDAVTQFIEGGECRHAGILTYFRDTQRIKRCGHCDICAPMSSRKIERPEMVEDSLQGASSNLRSKIKLRKPGRKQKEARRSDLAGRTLSANEQLREELLKTWRKTYAEQNDIPAFMVFSNKTMVDLVIKNPRTLNDLSKVYGFGAHKVEHLGDLILDQLRLTDK